MQSCIDNAPAVSQTPSEEYPSPSLHPNPCKMLHCRGQSVSAEPSQHPCFLPKLPRHPYLRRRQELCLSTSHPCHVQLRISSTVRPLSLLTLPFQQHRLRPQFTKPHRHPFKTAQAQSHRHCCHLRHCHCRCPCPHLHQRPHPMFTKSCRHPCKTQVQFHLQFAKCCHRLLKPAQARSRCHPPKNEQVRLHCRLHLQFTKCHRCPFNATPIQSHHHHLQIQPTKPHRLLRAPQVQSCHHRHRHSHHLHPLTHPFQ